MRPARNIDIIWECTPSARRPVPTKEVGVDPRATTRNNSPGWMDQIPGYRGYKQKELRREADRALRMYLAAKLADQLRKLDDAKLKLLNAGGLAQIALFERASTKLRTLIDTIKTASYGYAGLFDSDAVREPQLDALYAFDQALDGEVDALGAKVDALRAAVEGNQGIGPALDTVQSETDALLARFRTRDEAIQSGQGLPAESPRSVLEAAAPVKPAFLALQQLRLNDAISVGGKDYVIVSREQATVNGTNYLLYRLDSGARAKTLWVGPTERDLAVLDPYTPTVDAGWR